MRCGQLQNPSAEDSIIDSPLHSQTDKQKSAWVGRTQTPQEHTHKQEKATFCKGTVHIEL